MNQAEVDHAWRKAQRGGLRAQREAQYQFRFVVGIAKWTGFRVVECLPVALLRVPEPQVSKVSDLFRDFGLDAHLELQFRLLQVLVANLWEIDTRGLVIGIVGI